MASVNAISRHLRGSLDASIAAAVGVCLLLQPLPAAAKKRSEKPIQGDERILHTLDRLTFGPRPGDIASAQSVGLDRWFEQQLHPDKIDDSALDLRLSNYPAMNLSQADLIRRYPSPQVLRQAENGKVPIPQDAVGAAIYRDGIYREQENRKKQEERKANAANEMSMVQNGASATPTMAGTPPAASEDRLYAGLEAAKIASLPPDERMSKILAMQPAELASFRRSLRPAEVISLADGLNPDQREILMALAGGTRLVSTELIATRMLRDVYSQRQLQAVMTEFWLNHFSVYARKNQQEPYLLPAYERDVIRPHALGKFEDLLVATAHSPAMLVYLDNVESVGPDSTAAVRSAQFANAKNRPRPQGLNENYARELMELHTLGVNGGYTQADVTQVAKVFTGWTVEPLRGGEFNFNERRHEPGSKTVLGKTIHEGGEREGMEVLHMLATSPATAHFISNKLAVCFVSDTPPKSLVDRMTKAYLKSGGDIASVLRAMYRSPDFWSPEVYRAKVKTPLEFVVSAARATNAQIDNPLPMARALETLGMPFYGMQTPNGYSMTADAWVSTGALVNRMNFALSFASNRIAGTSLDWDALEAGAHQQSKKSAVSDQAQGPAATEAALESILLGVPAGEKTRQTVLAQIDTQTAQQQAEKQFSVRLTDGEPMAALLNASTPQRRTQPQVDRTQATMAGLLLGSPEFQRR